MMRWIGPLVDPLPLVCVRLLAAAACFLWVMWRAQLFASWRAHHRSLTWLGLFNTAVPFCLVTYAASNLPPSVASLLNATVPLFTALFSVLWLGDRLSGRQSLGLLLGFLGVSLMIYERIGLTLDFDHWAALSGLSGAALYGLCANAAKRYLSGLDSRVMAGGSTVAAALMVLPLGYLERPVEPVPAWVWLVGVALGVLCTAWAYLLYFGLLQRVGPAKVSAVTYLIPLFAASWGALLLHEPIGRAEVLCGILVFMAVRLVTR
jgi:drug/metabolite transporter (DMT)-like permease